ncbi:hypothetical protein [Sedimentisphaera salicampi]|uniref:hypothetical protein n=1 Tax=Sedimentisphaera salicampi TaxID=1941349 RepID=UPI000B9A52E1|nr:hypothetical protein [Sedimentisphaera salicampi]OXU15312.1 hypothetical protein SMSP1_00792 [Sedimentisphaera salicampi]
MQFRPQCVFFLFLASVWVSLPLYAEKSYSRKLNSNTDIDLQQIINNSSEHWRWLSLPGSRLVLNPSWEVKEPIGAMRKDLALDIGYWFGGKCWKLRDAVAITASENSKIKENNTLSLASAEEFTEIETWQTSNLNSKATEYGLKLTSEKDYGYAAFELPSSFSLKKLKVSIDIAETDGKWGLKFNSGKGPDRPVVVAQTHHTGLHTYNVDLSEMKNKGKKPLVKIFAVGKDKSVWIRSLKLTTVLEAGKEAEEIHTAWQPHKLTFKSKYEGYNIMMQGFDSLAGDNTVVRQIEFSNPWQRYVYLSGFFNNCNLLSGEPGVLVFGREEFNYAISFFKQSANGRLRRIKAKPNFYQDFWLFKYKPAKNETMVVSIGFSTVSEGVETALERAEDISAKEDILASTTSRWQELLNKIPVPENFGIEKVHPRGISGDDHKLFYYGAWCFLLSDILPVMPENKYGYPQIATGKPSGWNAGASKAKATAAWDSFVAQQLLGHICPQTAWDAFEGIMTQVDQTGWLEGECLPSRKAQTAWVLYDITQNINRLKNVYPAVKRYLLWREKNPRWIYESHNIPSEKDSSFITAWLADVKHAIKIAETLGKDEDVQMWQRRYKAMIPKYRKWLFHTDGSYTENFYFTDRGKHSHPSRPNSEQSYVLKGLYISDLPEKMNQDLIRYYEDVHNHNERLVGFDFIKYPEAQYIALGLIEQGLHEKAQEFINAIIRDTVITGEFTEVLEKGNTEPAGVVPSLFTAVQMIDFTLMKNHIRLDKGKLQPLDY